MMASPSPALRAVDQRVEAARLYRAGEFQILADGAGEIDVEAGERAIGQREMERRIIVVGEEAQSVQAGKVGLRGAGVRVPETRDEHRLAQRRARRRSSAAASRSGDGANIQRSFAVRARSFMI